METNTNINSCTDSSNMIISDAINSFSNTKVIILIFGYLRSTDSKLPLIDLIVNKIFHFTKLFLPPPNTKFFQLLISTKKYESEITNNTKPIIMPNSTQYNPIDIQELNCYNCQKLKCLTFIGAYKTCKIDSKKSWKYWSYSLNEYQCTLCKHFIVHKIAEFNDEGCPYSRAEYHTYISPFHISKYHKRPNNPSSGHPCKQCSKSTEEWYYSHERYRRNATSDTDVEIESYSYCKDCELYVEYEYERRD